MSRGASPRRSLCGSTVALRPTLSIAARAKARIQRLEREIKAARSKGDAARVAQLTSEHAWVVINSL